MNNYGTLRVKYIIWNQRIWNRERGEVPTAWTNWRLMEDRGDPTANHRSVSLHVAVLEHHLSD